MKLCLSTAAVAGRPRRKSEFIGSGTAKSPISSGAFDLFRTSTVQRIARASTKNCSVNSSCSAPPREHDTWRCFRPRRTSSVWRCRPIAIRRRPGESGRTRRPIELPPGCTRYRRYRALAANSRSRRDPTSPRIATPPHSTVFARTAATTDATKHRSPNSPRRTSWRLNCAGDAVEC